jgi:hypothetical protein
MHPLPTLREATQALDSSDNTELAQLCQALGHSPSRVPYTLHHDWVRSGDNSLSRSDVASMVSDTTGQDLHRAALAGAAKWAEQTELLRLNARERELCLAALVWAEDYRSRLLSKATTDAQNP